MLRARVAKAIVRALDGAASRAHRFADYCRSLSDDVAFVSGVGEPQEFTVDLPQTSASIPSVKVPREAADMVAEQREVEPPEVPVTVKINR